MTDLGEYAIVDVRKSSPSKGKILVVVDDEPTAQEMAIELNRRRCQVTVRPVVNKRIFVTDTASAQAHEATGK
jgi:hypothetical protein